MLPIEIDRACPTPFCTQLAEGLMEAIRVGAFKAGEVLPSLRCLAAEAGVSEIVARKALKRLAEEGLVMPRPRVGSVVLPCSAQVRRGHVLCVTGDHDINPLLGVMVEELRNCLTKCGYLFSQATILGSLKNPANATTLASSLDRPIDFAIALFTNVDVTAALSARGLPYVTVGAKGLVDDGGCVGQVVTSSRGAIKALVEDCCVKGIKRIIAHTCMARDSLVKTLTDVCEEAGIAVECRSAELFGFDRRFPSVMRAGYLCASKQKAAPPSVLHFIADDYFATGFFAGLAAHGLRTPADLRVVSYSNVGFGPFSPVAPTLISRNPHAHGREIARRVREWLLHKCPISETGLEMKYVRGKTF